MSNGPPNFNINNNLRPCSITSIVSSSPPLSYKTALAVQTADIVLQYTEYIVNRSDPTHMKVQLLLTK